MLDDPAQLWNLTSLDSATEPIALRGQEGNLYPMAISPDGQWLATTSSDKVVRIWDLTSLYPGAEHIALGGHEGSVDELIFGTDSSCLASFGSDGIFKMWTLDENELKELACRIAGRNLDCTR